MRARMRNSFQNNIYNSEKTLVVLEIFTGQGSPEINHVRSTRGQGLKKVHRLHFQYSTEFVLKSIISTFFVTWHFHYLLFTK